jgi:microcystin-dependent protein
MAEPFLSEIRMMSFGFAPKGWALCNGQLLPINQNQALFSLLGTNYGGDGRVNFGLPNLQGRTPIHTGGGHTLAELGGEQNHTVTTPEMAGHNHMVAVDSTTPATSNTGTPSNNAVLGQSLGVPSSGSNFSVSMYGNTANGTLNPHTIGNTGGSQAHANMQPYLTINFSIALQGIFPSQN